MGKPVVLKPSKWEEIKTRLSTEHPPSVMLIRSRMREVLGFTVRDHKRWVIVGPDSEYRCGGYYRDEVHLDFYNEAARTFFILKYLNTD